MHDVFGRQIAFDINHGSLAFTRVTEEDEAVVAIAPSWALAEIEATTIRSSPMKKRFIKLHRFIFYTLLYILYFIV
ncbi:Uncharacterised protein [Segatella copri]|nr:Uncharacterised protein [Segatella copri]